MVKGGQAREAAALSWERQGPAPDRTSYKNWAKSVLHNPAVVDYKVNPRLNLSFCSHGKKLTSWFVVAASTNRAGARNPLCSHEEEAPEEGAPAVPTGV